MDWFTVETLFTAGGAAAAIFVVTSVLHALKIEAPRVVALIVAMVISLGSIAAHHQPWSALNILVAILNAFISYLAAVGINNVTTSQVSTRTERAADGRTQYRWWP
ncbi:MAG TPA: hypothetical protein VIV66_12205 [Pyrinomonadaceae bacterium]